MNLVRSACSRMVAQQRVVAVALVLALGVCAGAQQTTSWDKCDFYCNRGGAACDGLKTVYTKLLACENYNRENRFLGRGPNTCSRPDFVFTRRDAFKFYTVRVCRNELTCIAAARKRNHPSPFRRLLMRTLEERAKNYRLMDEIRFSRDKQYVKSVDALTSDEYMAELRKHVAAKGFETETRFANPIFANNRRFVTENERLERRIEEGSITGTAAERKKEQRLFNNAVPRKFKAVTEIRSQLKSAATRAQVTKDLKAIRQYAKWIRQLELEAHLLQFYESEFVVVKKDVATKQAEVNALLKEEERLERYLTARKERVFNEKKNVVDNTRAATTDIIHAQRAKCGADVLQVDR